LKKTLDENVGIVHLLTVRVTVVIDDSLLEQARELTGIRDTTRLVQAGLQSLIACESARRLAGRGGTQKRLRRIRRRRPAASS
jgi:hypothetical protein